MSTNQTVRMFAPSGVGGLIQAPNGTYIVGSDGTTTVNAADVQALQALGFQFAVSQHESYFTAAAAAASATAVVSSVALSNGTLTIAAQPDVPRQLQAVVFPGTLPITAGVLTMTYTAIDGTTQVDALSMVMGSQAAGTAGGTLQTTKGVEHLTSAVITALAGGAAQNGIEIGTNTYLGLPMPPRYVDMAVTKETKVTMTGGFPIPSDEAVGTVVASSGLISPTVSPDAQHSFIFDYNFVSPG